MELERFVNLDTCVQERAKVDPLIGDALGAIGYDTFLRDACRMLEATKDRKKETCDRIDSSALRQRCLTWVAIVSQTPDACPLLYASVPTRGRAAMCVAVAGRDPRLCAGEGRAAPRATCEGLVARERDPGRRDEDEGLREQPLDDVHVGVDESLEPCPLDVTEALGLG